MTEIGCVSQNIEELQQVIQDVICGEITLFQVSHIDLIHICQIFMYHDKLGKDFDRETGTFEVDVENGKTLEEINRQIKEDLSHDDENGH